MTADDLYALISPARLLDLHANAIANYGGHPGVRIEGCVDGVVGNAVSNCIYSAAETGDEPDYICFLAHLMRGINGSHCFNDGNKRLTWMVIEEVLRKVDLRLECGQAEGAAFVRQMASERMTPQQIASWLIDRICSV